MKKKSAILLAMLLAGCATPYQEAPTPVNFPASTQPKLQAAAHWNAIADDVAGRIAMRLASLGEKKSLYLAPMKASTAFERAFTDLLSSALSSKGLELVKRPAANAWTLETTTQVLEFSPAGRVPPYHGHATGVVAGVYALHVGEATAGAAISSLIIAADAASWFHSQFATRETPQTEIIVTVSIGDQDRHLYKTTSIYYVTNADKLLYMTTAPMTTISVKGGE